MQCGLLSKPPPLPPCRRRHAGLALAVNMQGCAALCTKRAARIAAVAFEATPAATDAAGSAAMRTVRRMRRLTTVSSTRLLGQGHKGCGCESAALRRFFVPCLA